MNEDPCPFCGGDPQGLKPCCDDNNYEWDVEATSALCVEVME